MSLTSKQFKELSEFIYAKTGIRLDPKKIHFLSMRVLKRALHLEIDDLDDYIRHVRYLDRKGNELQNLINAITINETYFFREFPQLQIFGEYCLEEILKRKAANNDYTIKIWSAACSSGAEPYSIAIILREMIDDFDRWRIELLATDIDEKILQDARNAVYNARAVKYVPPSYREKYIIDMSDEEFTVTDDIKKMVSFKHLNLSEKTDLRGQTGFDFIFCKNVLIYFDDISRKQVVDHFYVALKPGGYIYLSATESIGRISTAFHLKKVEHDGDTHLLYCKEGEV